MNEQRANELDKLKYLLLGIVLTLFLLFLFLHPRTDNTYDTQMVEVLIVEKEIAQLDGKDIYIIYGEDRNGIQKSFQITNEAMSDHFEESEVYQEIKTGKYYKFKIADEETFNSYYPSICGAVKLIDGFSPESEGQQGA